MQKPFKPIYLFLESSIHATLFATFLRVPLQRIGEQLALTVSSLSSQQARLATAALRLWMDTWGDRRNVQSPEGKGRNN